MPEGLRLVIALGTFWGLAGRIRDAFSLADPVLAAHHDADPGGWAMAVSVLSWVRISAGDIEFSTTSTSEGINVARALGDVASEARFLYGLSLAAGGESALFERVHELGAAANDTRFTVFGALLSVGSLIGTDGAQPLFERVRALGAAFDDETFHYVLSGWMALHAALRGDCATAQDLPRLAFVPATLRPRSSR